MAFYHWHAGTNTIIFTYNPKSSYFGLIVERFEMLIREAALASRRPLVQLGLLNICKVEEHTDELHHQLLSVMKELIREK